MTRVLLVDDDYLFLECLEHTLSKDYDDFQIVGKLDFSTDIVNSVDELTPDVMIIGIRPNSDHGIEYIETIHGEFPKVKVIALSVSEDGNNLPRLINAGISAYLLRSCSIFELAESILSVVNGVQVLTPSMIGKLMEAFRRQSHNAQNQGIFSLSDREKEILKYVATGASNKEIAQSCYISETTVKTHLRNILSKMEVKNRAGAVSLATTMGILPKVSREEVSTSTG
ncbi:MAG: response regulator transcription factor [Dehalococcoidales bacterium]|nr:MAG: response regulator transcription factor [Dehalococcoidales bacterium]